MSKYDYMRANLVREKTNCEAGKAASSALGPPTGADEDVGRLCGAWSFTGIRAGYVYGICSRIGTTGEDLPRSLVR